MQALKEYLSPETYPLIRVVVKGVVYAVISAAVLVKTFQLFELYLLK